MKKGETVVYDPQKLLKEKEELYTMLLGRNQFFISRFENSREEFLDDLEKDGFCYEEGHSRETVVESSFPIVVKLRGKLISSMGNTTVAAASVKHHISDDAFIRFYSDFYYVPFFFNDPSELKPYYDIVESVYAELSKKYKEALIEHPVPTSHHFDLGLYIRNKYIYPNLKSLFCAGLVTEADALSGWVVGQIIRKLYEEKAVKY